MTMHPAQKLSRDIIEYGRLALVAMVMIVIVYMVAQSLWGQVPATIGSIVLGIAAVFIIATNKTVRDKISSSLGGKK